MTSLVLTACATEIVDPTARTTTTVPPQLIETITEVGPLAQADLGGLARVLSAEVELLGNAIFVGNTASAKLHLGRINETWDYLEPKILAELGEQGDQIAFDLTRVINLARSSVERNRPADASKARSFLRLALASLDG